MMSPKVIKKGHSSKNHKVSYLQFQTIVKLNQENETNLAVMSDKSSVFTFMSAETSGFYVEYVVLSVCLC